MDPIGSYTWMFGFQMADCLGRVRRRGFIGGGVSLGVGVEVSEAMPGPVAFSLPLPVDQEVST